MAAPKSSRTPQKASPALPRPDARIPPYDLLKQAILSGDLLPGQPLVETSLAAWCGVSRTPIREALRRLEQDGLVEHNDHGLAVRYRSPEEIIDLYDTRIVLEATAGGVAAERRTDHDVRSLRWNIERSRDVSDMDADAMVDLNHQFHRTVWLASHNESLIDLLERLDLHLARYPGTTLTSPGRWATAIEEHLTLTDAIENRDGPLAHEIAKTHFTEARDIRLSLFAQEDPTG